MEDNVWKMREIVRKLEMVQGNINRINSYLEDKIDRNQVSDELLRALSSPTEELEWRVDSIWQNLNDMEE